MVNMDWEAVKTHLIGVVPQKTAGSILLVFGILFISLAGSLVATNQETLPAADLGVALADIILSILLVAGGVLLLLKRPPGYASGLVLLLGASMLFLGLIVFLVLRPLLMDIPFDLTELITVFIMGLVCFVPFALYWRGVGSKEEICMNRATRIIVSTIGVILAIAGMEHGFFETLQGNTPNPFNKMMVRHHGDMS